MHATPTGLFELGAVSAIPPSGWAYYPQKKTRALQFLAVCKAPLQAALQPTQRFAQDQISTGVATMPRFSQLMKTHRMPSVRLAEAVCVYAAEVRNLLRVFAALVASLPTEFISVRLLSGGAPMNRSLGWSGDEVASWDRAGRVAQSR
ncbi:hypothetical protein [Ralstonia condita]|jgi:hypothetical protein|uniref:hypothetical protein n=1 Tax=Ralstonia condita TaxID=3058600 RepID=UPI002931884E|nr:hypothetical protein [Ralstonia sp. LMG 7141]